MTPTDPTRTSASEPDDETRTQPPAEPGAASDAALDAGLAAAFAPDRTGSFHPTPEPEPDTILAGKYRLTERIGEGGMGSVWVAHQTEPVKRKVAIKLIKPGMDSRQVLIRFEAERQALAVMDHPNIAKVLDGGLHDGRPFFVMELVKGVPITEYCDQRKLTPKERLELFVPVCQAIQHAHQKGVIHRDIKPSNVLIALYDDKPVPKVIDFGVAKATGGTLTEHTIETAFGGVVGTPQYMSPEQASLNNLDIDTRSDVYSLGVLLYELLTGSPPFSRKDLEKKGLLEILRVVREEEPPRPSTKLSTADALPTLSANRGTEPGKLTKLLRSELDWIVMKALEKDRARRYETANGFAADVNRYLAGEPVQAHPPSAIYRVRKFFQKNRPTVVATAVVAIALVVGTAVATWQAVRATRAETLAQRRLDEEVRARAEAEAVRDFFVDDMIGWVAPERKLGRQVTVDQVLVGAERAIGTRFRNQPLLEAAVRLTLGRVYRDLGQYEKAEGHLRLAQSLFAEHLGPPHRRTLEAMNLLGHTLWLVERNDEAARLLEAAAELGRQEHGPEDHETLWALFHLANVRDSQGDHEEAVRLMRRVLEARRRLYGNDHMATSWARHDLAHLIFDQGSWDEVKQLIEEEAESRTRTLGPDHPDTLFAQMDLAELLSMQGQFTEARRLLEHTLERFRQVCGPDHTRTLVAETSLASVLASRPDAAPDDLARILELGKRIVELKVPGQPPMAWNSMGIAHYRRGDWKAALAALREADAGSRGSNKCRNDFFLAMTHHQIGNKNEAREHYGRAADWLDKSRSSNPELHRFRREAAEVLGIKDAAKARLDEPKP